MSPLAAWDDAIAYQHKTLRWLCCCRIGSWCLIAACLLLFGWNLHLHRWFWSGILVGGIMLNCYAITENTKARDRVSELFDCCVRERQQWTS